MIRDKTVVLCMLEHEFLSEILNIWTEINKVVADIEWQILPVAGTL